MVTKLTGAAVKALQSALVVVLMFFLLLGVAKWAKANPEDFDVVIGKIGGAAVSIVSWICDGIVSLLDSD